jgi:hypothetical protein
VAHSRASPESGAFFFLSLLHADDHFADRGRNPRHPTAGPGGRRPAGRRRHRALHRPLPQGSHRRARRHPAARAGIPPGLPARAAGPPCRHPESHRRAGQAHPRAARRHRGRTDQAGAGRPLPALQDQAPHQRPDRPRSRHRAPGRAPVCQPVAEPVRRGRGLRAPGRQRGGGRLFDRAGRARRRARHPERALGRRRRAGAEPARVAVGQRPAQSPP